MALEELFKEYNMLFLKKQEILYSIMAVSLMLFFMIKIVGTNHQIFIGGLVLSSLLLFFSIVYKKYISVFHDDENVENFFNKSNDEQIVLAVINHPRSYLYTGVFIMVSGINILFQQTNVAIISIISSIICVIICNMVLSHKYHMYNLYIKAKKTNNFSEMGFFINSKNFKKYNRLLMIDFACHNVKNNHVLSMNILDKVKADCSDIVSAKLYGYAQLGMIDEAILLIIKNEKNKHYKDYRLIKLMKIFLYEIKRINEIVQVELAELTSVDRDSINLIIKEFHETDNEKVFLKKIMQIVDA